MAPDKNEVRMAVVSKVPAPISHDDDSNDER
jgi:hypothetical protein